ncbi:efflux RND transporter periplasmic adaptor subunit [Chelatococcus reniformis]|uniref:MexE family multidrug efflux RND transporter periplasmic adaptor subunit n=1 Tax=Chelatococcus reniformis TaxID=1494448 RepID=A0A916URT9_9HYPH|nr:efflux RND transporter periplasmic adaptor subunit [Chelatococcus reniformis]GGC84187.1 MexE family multidrug efflux RND transporter periplasmic adaptor subunit [Chelatococcus reniformis]
MLRSLLARVLPSVALVAALAACNEPATKPPGAGGAGAAAPPAPVVTVAKPVVKQVTEYDDFTGRFEAVDSVEVRSRVSGYLSSVEFKDGAVVKKGDLLFVIDKRPYQAATDQAIAGVNSAQARVQFAKSDLERAQSLQKTGNITEQVLETRRQTALVAQGDLAGANAAVVSAKLNLEFTEIRAPVSGRIGRKLISEGNLVTADSTLLTTIVSLDPIYFYFDIDERSYLAYQRLNRNRGTGGSIASDVLVGVTDERQPTRKGKLDFLDNRIDQATGTLRARALVPNPDLFLAPGMFGTVRIPGSDPYRGVLVPDVAIATDQDRRLVWVLGADDTVSPKVVRPGPRIDGYRLIRSGLDGSETIVINGLQRLRPGIKVKPEMKELPPTAPDPAGANGSKS